MQPKKIAIKLLQKVGALNPGEVCGYDAPFAKALVDKGFAEYANGPPQGATGAMLKHHQTPSENQEAIGALARKPTLHPSGPSR